MQTLVCSYLYLGLRPLSSLEIDLANVYDEGVIEDARYKRKEALADLAAAVTKKT